MSITYKKFAIQSFEKELIVNVEFSAGDLDEAKALIEGCRSLGARGTVAQETTKPKDKKAKKEPEPPPVEEEEEDEDEEEEEEDEEEEAPKKKAKSKSADKEEDEDDEEEDEEPDDEEEEESDDEEGEEDEDEDEKPAKKKGKSEAKASGKLPQIKLTKEMTKPDYRFRDVIKSLIDQGVTKKADLIRVCEKIKEQVPCVAKVSDMSDRVSRAAEMLGVDIS